MMGIYLSILISIFNDSIKKNSEKNRIKEIGEKNPLIKIHKITLLYTLFRTYYLLKVIFHIFLYVRYAYLKSLNKIFYFFLELDLNFRFKFSTKLKMNKKSI